jgi:hypothetical protein
VTHPAHSQHERKKGYTHGWGVAFFYLSCPSVMDISQETNPADGTATMNEIRGE